MTEGSCPYISELCFIDILEDPALNRNFCPLSLRTEGFAAVYITCRPHRNCSHICSHLIYQLQNTVHWGWTERSWERIELLACLAKKKSTCFILNSESWHLLPFWNITRDWSSRSCIFNAFSSSGPYLTPRPPFSLRCWFNMISALYRNEGSVNKAHEPAEAVSAVSPAPGGCLQSSWSWELPVIETYLFFSRKDLNIGSAS